jgi:hypothetical protein
MELTKGEFSQFSLEGRDGLLAIHGTFIAKKEYARQSFSVYLIFGFYVCKIIDNETCSVTDIEVISESIVGEIFIDK